MSKIDQADIDALVSGVLKKITRSCNDSAAMRSFTQVHNAIMNSDSSQNSSSINASGKRKAENAIEVAQMNSDVYDTSSTGVSSLKERKQARSNVFTNGLMSVKPLEMDDQLKRDIKVIQMRNYMDPKRFYKNADKMTKILHTGTVIEGSAEYKSSRMSRKDRRQTVVEEVMGDSSIKGYTKRKFQGIQEAKAKIAKHNKKHKGSFKKLGGVGKR